MSDSTFSTIASQPKIIIEGESQYNGRGIDISSYSSNTNSADDVWILDKYYKKVNCNSTLRKFSFTYCKDADSKYILKQYFYKCILQSTPFETLRKYSDFIKYFTNFILENYSISKYYDITPLIIEHYYNYLINLDLTMKVKRDRWYSLKIFLDYSGFQNLSMQMGKYEFVYVPTERNDEKYISDYVADQLDNILVNDDFPTNYRTMYWLMRLYPCRFTEIASTNINCLRKYVDDVYIFTSVVFKTSCRDENGTIKMLYMNSNEEYQRMLIGLIQTQQEIARKINATGPNSEDFLFLSPRYRFYKNRNEYLSDKMCNKISTKGFNDFLLSIVNRYGIKEEDGSYVNITSHKFRHKAITDRIESKLFRPIDLLPMTLHTSTNQIEDYYYHPQDIVKKAEDIRRHITKETVIFKGKVVNSKDDIVFERFLRSPFAYSLKDMGICTDTRDCNKDKLHCLGCDYFIPDCNNLDYFEYQLDDWENKYLVAKRSKNQYMMENAQYNIKLHGIVINKIKKALSNQSKEVLT